MVQVAVVPEEAEEAEGLVETVLALVEPVEVEEREQLIVEEVVVGLLQHQAPPVEMVEQVWL
jgi:hypothetical protein